MRLGRSRFQELVGRQLDLFESDQAPLLEEAREADAAWTNAAREEAEELYGDYQLVVDDLASRLHDVRETYAATLDEQTSEEYRDAFTREAMKRFRRYAGMLGEDE